MVGHCIAFEHLTWCFAKFDTSNFDVAAREPEDLQLNLPDKRRPKRNSCKMRIAKHDVDNTRGANVPLFRYLKNVPISNRSILFQFGRTFHCHIVYRLALRQELYATAPRSPMRPTHLWLRRYS